MARVRVRVNVHRDVVSARLGLAADRWAHGLGREVRNQARRRAPVDDGRLRSSIDYAITRRGNRVSVVVGSPLPYARYVHEGTGIYGPHGTPIVPVTAKALKFEVRGIRPGRRGPTRTPKGKGTIVFAKSVKGMEGTPYLADALQAVLPTKTRRK